MSFLGNIRRKVRDITIERLEILDQLTINGTPLETTTLLVAPSDVADLNGEKLVIDADADTYIRQTGGPSGTDDSVDVYVNGALDFQIAANLLTAKAGSVIATDVISETTSATGVTADGVLLKDGTVTTDTLIEKTAANGVDIDGLKVKDNTLQAWKRNIITKSADFTCQASESGCTYEIGAADKVATLPATSQGLCFRFQLATAALSSGTGFSVSPNASDAIMGNGFTTADNKDAICAGSGDRVGDLIEVTADNAGVGWLISAVIGTWTRET